MENVKNLQNVSVNSDSLNHGLNEKSQNLGKLIPVSSEDCPSSWDDLCNAYNVYDCLSDHEFFMLNYEMAFDHE